LRRICGLPANDGQIIRPSDEPTMASMVHDWDLCLATACARREELRKQKWNIKSIELQLRAAKNLARPQLSFVSQYQLNGFGQYLFGDNSIPAGTPGAGIQNFTRNMLQADNTGWNVGLQFAMPLGLRNAHAQVRNTELRLMKAQAALEVQEMEVSHELATVFQSLDFYYQNMQTSYNRREVAVENLKFAKVEFDHTVGRDTLMQLRQAQRQLAIADQSFYRGVVEYNKSLVELQYRQGMLLEYNHIHLAERDWGTDAKAGAKRLAEARSYGIDTPSFDPVRHEPAAFTPRHFSMPETTMPETTEWDEQMELPAPLPPVDAPLELEQLPESGSNP
jgi:outer membrane protein TolC